MPKAEHSEDQHPVAAPSEVLELVARFEQQLAAYTSGPYNEAQLRQEFLNPLFKANVLSRIGPRYCEPKQ